MHQSVRMVCASFLVEYLGVSWVEGALQPSGLEAATLGIRGCTLLGVRGCDPVYQRLQPCVRVREAACRPMRPCAQRRH